MQNSSHPAFICAWFGGFHGIDVAFCGYSLSLSHAVKLTVIWDAALFYNGVDESLVPIVDATLKWCLILITQPPIDLFVGYRNGDPFFLSVSQSQIVFR